MEVVALLATGCLLPSGRPLSSRMSMAHWHTVSCSMPGGCYQEYTKPSCCCDRLHEIVDKPLLSDSPPGVPCHSELLAYLANNCLQWCGQPGWLVGNAVLVSEFCIVNLQNETWFNFREMPVRWPQGPLIKAIRKIFPAEWLEGCKPPILEDIVNSEPFTIYPDWLAERGLDDHMPLAPVVLSAVSKGARALAGQDQRGHFFVSESVPQTVGTWLRGTRAP